MPRRPRPVYVFGADGRIVREYRTASESVVKENISKRKLYAAIRLKQDINGLWFSFTRSGLYHSDELFDVDIWAEMMKA